MSCPPTDDESLRRHAADRQSGQADRENSSLESSQTDNHTAGLGRLPHALYAAVAIALVADDGARQCWATIRSGLNKGLLRTIDLDADSRPPARKRRRTTGKQRSAT